MKLENIIKKEQKRFSELLLDIRDPISALLKVHLIIEQSLEVIIKNNLSSPETLLKKGRLTFNQKILLVGAMDVLDSKTYNAIRKLNDIRNDCAHKLEVNLDKEQIEKLGNELRPWFTKIKKESPNDHEKWLGLILPYLAGKTASFTLKQTI